MINQEYLSLQVKIFSNISSDISNVSKHDNMNLSDSGLEQLRKTFTGVDLDLPSVPANIELTKTDSTDESVGLNSPQRKMTEGQIKNETKK